ncbi:hypothetical protein FRB97_005155 [Tulasnella sp. 331]|nr:hypothetical protein FRB97_005155 [Tulasnella sp. 331]KAG8880647.1 hypothetical protein FRB98_004961 [Tulasnella sp. 332]
MATHHELSQTLLNLPVSKTGYLTFEGKDDEDVTLFLRDFKRLALSCDRHQDEDWMADQMEASLAGLALRWYLTLETVERRIFTSLRIAMLERFQPSANVPAPLAPAPILSKHLVIQRKNARIKIIRPDGQLLGFVKEEGLVPRWGCGVAETLEEAVIIESYLFPGDAIPGVLKLAVGPIPSTTHLCL